MSTMVAVTFVVVFLFNRQPALTVHQERTVELTSPSFDLRSRWYARSVNPMAESSWIRTAESLFGRRHGHMSADPERLVTAYP